MSTQTDDIARLTAIVVHQHVQQRLAASLRQGASLSTGGIAKACGVTPSQVTSWESGDSRPTTQQALAWLEYLYDRVALPFAKPQVVASNGEREWYGSGPVQVPVPQEVVLRGGGRRTVFEANMSRAPKEGLIALADDLSRRPVPGQGGSPVVRAWNPESAFFQVLYDSLSSSHAIRVEHSLDKQQATQVHNALHTAVRRSRDKGDKYMEGAASWLAAEWDAHIKWKGLIWPTLGDGGRPVRAGEPAEDFAVSLNGAS